MMPALSDRIKRSATILILIVALSALYFVFSLKPFGRIIDRTQLLMGTIVQIKVSLENERDAKRAELAIDRAFDEISRIESVFSTYKNTSEVSRINRLGPGERLEISDEVFELTEKSIKYSKRTRGAFDITVKPLIDLWAVTEGPKRIPSLEEISEALARVGSKYIILDRRDKTISFDRGGMALDFGGVAKGYASDRAIEVLKNNGIKNAIVASAGDMYCLGRKQKKELWKVGIQHPRDKNKLFLRIKLENMAISTSGDYERYFIFGGKRYSHIIDPRTGYPVPDRVISASVIAPDSTTADIMATALSVLGEEALDVVREIRGADAVMIFKEGEKFRTEMTPSLERRYEVIKGEEFKE